MNHHLKNPKNQINLGALYSGEASQSSMIMRCFVKMFPMCLPSWESSLYDLTAKQCCLLSGIKSQSQKRLIRSLMMWISGNAPLRRVRGGWWTVNISFRKNNKPQDYRDQLSCHPKFIFAYQSQQNASHWLVGGKIICFPSNMSPCAPQVRVDPSS